MIRPLWIAEIDRIAVESVCLQWRPDGINQICTGLHHDIKAIGCGNGEPELILLYAKADITDLRVPQHRWTTTICCIPIRSSRQVIDGRIGGITGKYRRANGSIALKIDAFQASTRERIDADVGDAGGDCDTGQTGTGIKGPEPNIDDAIGNFDVVQSGATVKRHVSDVDDIVGNCVASLFTPRTLDERCSAFVEQDPIYAAIEEIPFIYRYPCQVGAEIKRLTPDVGYTLRNRNASQAAASIERRVPNTGNVGADRNAGQVVAPKKYTPPYAGDAVAYYGVGQVGKIFERSEPDTFNVVGNYDADQAFAVIERTHPDVGNTAADRNVGQTSALFECTIPDVGNIVRNRDADQIGTIRKRPTSDAGDAAADRNVGQAVAGVERTVPDIGNIVRYRDAGQAGAIRKRPASDAGNIDWYRDADQISAIRKCTVPDVGDTIWDCDTDQLDAARKRIATNAGDCSAIDHIGNGHHTAGTAVSSDGDHAIIGRVSVIYNYIGCCYGDIPCRHGHYGGRRSAICHYRSYVTSPPSKCTPDGWFIRHNRYPLLVGIRTAAGSAINGKNPSGIPQHSRTATKRQVPSRGSQ